MAIWGDLRDWLKARLIPGTAEGSRRPDGGTSCYRPVQRKSRRDEQRTAEAAAQAYEEGNAQIPYVHTGFTDMNPPAGGTWGPGGMGADPYGYGAAQAAQQEYRASYAAGQEAPAANNISYMPGAYAPDAGNSFTHVEHILAITSLRSCYEAIECMKNGETLIVTLDVLGSEGERIRCQDMLAGAAFTLGCSVRTLQSAGIVVIVPQGVKILPEQQAPAYSQYQPQPVPVQEEYTPRRERRSSQNPVGWENAGARGQSYNPYTGAMPAAAGDYGMYGGY